MEQLLELLTEIKPGVDFQSSNNLIDDGIIDSFDLVVIVGEINVRFDVSIAPDDLEPENFNSVDAIWALIQRLLNE